MIKKQIIPLFVHFMPLLCVCASVLFHINFIVPLAVYPICDGIYVTVVLAKLTQLITFCMKWSLG